MRHALFWLLSLSALQAVHAQEAEMPLDDDYAIGSLEEGAPDLFEEPGPGPKKIPDAALGLSMGLTTLSFIIGGELAGVGKNAEIPALQVAGFGVLAGGLVVCPSLGHVYAEDKKRALIGMGFRAGTVLLGSSFLLIASRSDSTFVDAGALGVAGLMGAITIIDATIEVADSERAVKRYNEQSQ